MNDPLQNHPIMIVKRICDQKKIPGEVLLGYLFHALQQSRAMHATMAQSATADVQPTIVQELTSAMQLLNRKEAPVSLLGALDLAVSVPALLASANKQPDLEVFKTLQLIIKEVSNVADRTALINQMNFDKFMKENADRISPLPDKTQWKLNPETQELEAEQPDDDDDEAAKD